MLRRMPEDWWYHFTRGAPREYSTVYCSSIHVNESKWLNAHVSIFLVFQRDELHHLQSKYPFLLVSCPLNPYQPNPATWLLSWETYRPFKQRQTTLFEAIEHAGGTDRKAALDSFDHANFLAPCDQYKSKNFVCSAGAVESKHRGLCPNPSPHECAAAPSLLLFFLSFSGLVHLPFFNLYCKEATFSSWLSLNKMNKQWFTLANLVKSCQINSNQSSIAYVIQKQKQGIPNHDVH